MTALESMYWRAEILQAMYWMRGEGIDDEVEPLRLAEFLMVEADEVQRQMHDLAEDGYLTLNSSERYALTPRGVEEGGRSFADEFADLTHPAHYECAPGCWCHDPDHAGEPCPGEAAPPAKPDEEEPTRES